MEEALSLSPVVERKAVVDSCGPIRTASREQRSARRHARENERVERAKLQDMECELAVVCDDLAEARSVRPPTPPYTHHLHMLCAYVHVCHMGDDTADVRSQTPEPN